MISKVWKINKTIVVTVPVNEAKALALKSGDLVELELTKIKK